MHAGMEEAAWRAWLTAGGLHCPVQVFGQQPHPHGHRSRVAGGLAPRHPAGLKAVVSQGEGKEPEPSLLSHRGVFPSANIANQGRKWVAKGS